MIQISSFYIVKGGVYLIANGIHSKITFWTVFVSFLNSFLFFCFVSDFLVGDDDDPLTREKHNHQCLGIIRDVGVVDNRPCSWTLMPFGRRGGGQQPAQPTSFLNDAWLQTHGSSSMPSHTQLHSPFFFFLPSQKEIISITQQVKKGKKNKNKSKKHWKVSGLCASTLAAAKDNNNRKKKATAFFLARFATCLPILHSNSLVHHFT